MSLHVLHRLSTHAKPLMLFVVVLHGIELKVLVAVIIDGSSFWLWKNLCV